MLLNRNRVHTNTVAENAIFPNVKEIIQMGTTFFFTVIAWVFFRSETVTDAFSYLSGMLSLSLFTYPEVFPKKIILLVVILVCIEWVQRNKQHALQIETMNHFTPLLLRWGIYYGTILSILQFGGKPQAFIYFNF